MSFKTPFERGKEARRQGKTLADNPYNIMRDRIDGWDAGWNAEDHRIKHTPNVACADALMGALGYKRVPAQGDAQQSKETETSK